MADDVALAHAPYGYDVFTHTEVVPKPAPEDPNKRLYVWHIGLVRLKPDDGDEYAAAQRAWHAKHAPPRSTTTGNETIIMQLTADQQVDLSISGEDKYDNKVDISGTVVWLSSDEQIVHVTQHDNSHATASAVGPIGSAAVTVTNDLDADGEGDFIGSIAIDVVAGEMAEIVVTAGTPTDKPA